MIELPATALARRRVGVLVGVLLDVRLRAFVFDYFASFCVLGDPSFDPYAERVQSLTPPCWLQTRTFLLANFLNLFQSIVDALESISFLNLPPQKQPKSNTTHCQDAIHFSGRLLIDCWSIVGADTPPTQPKSTLKLWRFSLTFCKIYRSK